MVLNVALLSDVHLELSDRPYDGIDRYISPHIKDIDIICLCGDIGSPNELSYHQFIMDCAKRCARHTFVIMGNHEAYGMSVEECQKKIANVCSSVNEHMAVKNKVMFLNNTMYDVESYRFMGTTLWSEIDNTEAWHIRCCVSDFHRIKDWSIGNWMNAFFTSISWLRSNLDNAYEDDKQVVVLSHHAPLLELGHPKYADSDLKSAYASDLSGLLKNHADVLRYWFYGHNHYSQSITYENTHIISNQVGYEGESACQKNYRPDLIISLPSVTE